MNYRARSSLCAAIALTACAPPRDGAKDSSSPATDTSAQAGSVRTFPLVGVAVTDTLAAWCVAFPRDTAAGAVSTGQRVTIVFAGRSDVPVLRAKIERERSAACHAEFGQSRWTDYAAYDLALLDSIKPEEREIPSVGLAVLAAVAWTRGADGLSRADLDGDGSPEEARRCAADEGEHFTIWSRRSDGTWLRRAHEYYDWGALVEPTCRPGDDGR